MRKLIKFFVIVLVLLFVFFVAAMILVPRLGKDIAVKQIEKALGKKTTLEKIDFRIPLGVTIKKLEIQGLCNIDEISVSPSILGFFAGKIILNDLRLISPQIYLEQSAEGKFNFIPAPTAPAGYSGQEVPAPAPILKENKQKLPEVILTGLVVKDGKITFNDKKISSAGLEIILKNININVSKIKFLPTALRAYFQASANLVSPENSWLGSFDAKGWIDWGKKDMDAKFDVKNFEAAYFYPYTGDFISQRKVISAKVDLASTLKAQNNDLEAACDFNLHNLAYAQVSAEKEITNPFDMFTKNALDLFMDPGGNLKLEFTVDTKLDQPELGGKKLKRIILEAAAKNLLNQDPRDVAAKLEKTVKDFTDFGKQVSDIFKSK